MEVNYSGLIALVIFLIALVFFLRHEALSEDEQEVEETVVKEAITPSNPLDVNDEDALVACLIASIECRNETKKNVQVLGVRKVN